MLCITARSFPSPRDSFAIPQSAVAPACIHPKSSPSLCIHSPAAAGGSRRVMVAVSSLILSSVAGVERETVYLCHEFVLRSRLWKE